MPRSTDVNRQLVLKSQWEIGEGKSYQWKIHFSPLLFKCFTFLSKHPLLPSHKVKHREHQTVCSYYINNLLCSSLGFSLRIKRSYECKPHTHFSETQWWKAIVSQNHLNIVIDHSMFQKIMQWSNIHSLEEMSKMSKNLWSRFFRLMKMNFLPRFLYGRVR